MWKQKIYKSLFSILLTGICVTAVTYAASVSYIKDGEVLTEQYMSTLVDAINSKADINSVYTKAQIDSKIPKCGDWEVVTADGVKFICVTGNTTPPPPPTDPVNGQCGSSHQKSFYNKPTSNLCSTWNIVWADNTGTDGTFNWQCLWQDWGTPASCNATKYKCDKKTFKIYNDIGRSIDYTTGYGMLGNTENTSGEKPCDINRYRMSRQWSQSINYEFTCTNNGWFMDSTTWICIDNSF